MCINKIIPTRRGINNYPLLRVFKSLRDGYFYIYDSRLNEFVSMEGQTFNFLKNYLKTGILSDKDNKCTNDCEKANFLKDINKYTKDRCFFLKGELTCRVSTDPKEIDLILKKDFLANPIGGLCIEVTNQCNLRCKYCPFTIRSAEERLDRKCSVARTHGLSKISFVTAKKAIDFYFEEQLSRKFCKALQNTIIPSLSFYGGEPLLAFPLIQQCINYYRNLPWGDLGWDKHDLRLNITTNLTINDRQIIDKLIEEDIGILVSLDGPKLENDKYRVFAANDQSVFEQVIDNLRYIFEKNNEFFARHVHFSAVHAPGHNMEAVHQFFSVRSDVPFAKLLDGSRVHYAGAQDYRRCSKHKHKSAITDEVSSNSYTNGVINKCIELLLSAQNENEVTFIREDGIMNNLICDILVDYDNRPRFQKGSNKVNFTSTCIPGIQKIFVDIFGNIHACERTDHSFPLGHVFTGFDTNRIKSMLHSFFCSMDSLACRKCWAFRFCPFCPAGLLEEGRIKVPLKSDCNDFRTRTELLLSNYLMLRRDNPAIFEWLSSYKHPS